MGPAMSVILFIFMPNSGKPPANYGVWTAELPSGSYRDALENPRLYSSVPGRKSPFLHAGRWRANTSVFYGEFSTHSNEVVLLKGWEFLSSASKVRANNLKAEISGWKF